PGDHRPHGRRGRPRRGALLRHPRLVVLAGRAPVLPDRLPQPIGGAAQLVGGVLDPPARGADHPRRRRSTRYKVTIDATPGAGVARTMRWARMSRPPEPRRA